MPTLWEFRVKACVEVLVLVVIFGLSLMLLGGVGYGVFTWIVPFVWTWMIGGGTVLLNPFFAVALVVCGGILSVLIWGVLMDVLTKGLQWVGRR